MRKGSLLLLLSVMLASPVLHAEQTPPDLADAERQVELEQQLLDNQAQRQALKAVMASQPDTSAQQAQLARLQEENRRLRLQLQQEQAKPQPQWLGEDQQWFAVGGGVGVLGFLLGVLTTRGRRRRQWLN